MNKILVTGSTGFLGKNLCERLIKDGCKVNVFIGDLRNLKNIKDFIYKVKPTIIYHLAGIVNLSRDYDTALKCIDVNIGGTLNLLEALKENPPQRFIFPSTEEVYGNGPIPYKESQLTNPPSPYSISKIAAEQFIHTYSQKLGFSYFIFRIATMYGYYQPPTRLIAQIINKAFRDEDIPINSGKKKRDYVFVEDVVRALILAKNSNAKSAIVNLGGGESYSLEELTRRIIDYSCSKSKIVFGAFSDRPFEADEWLLDNQKAKDVLNWKPQISLFDGLKKTVGVYG